MVKLQQEQLATFSIDLKAEQIYDDLKLILKSDSGILLKNILMNKIKDF